ncbi:MAG TPA: NAD(P)H-dependent oxidoreductase [Paenirhodobacter sp.]
MAQISIMGLAGNLSPVSKTRNFVETALSRAATRVEARTGVIDIAGFGAELGVARSLADFSPAGRARIDRLLTADALIVATPVYKGSYPGLFKHLIDLLDTTAFLHKPVLLASVGGGDRHALAVEHQLRPLFAFFEARVLATAIHVSDRDFSDGALRSDTALTRLDRALGEFEAIFPAARKTRQALSA